MIFHHGDQPGFTSFLTWIRELDVVIVVLAADELKLDPIVLPAVAGLPTRRLARSRERSVAGRVWDRVVENFRHSGLEESPSCQRPGHVAAPLQDVRRSVARHRLLAVERGSRCDARAQLQLDGSAQPIRARRPRAFGVFRLRVADGACATADRVAGAWKKRFDAMKDSPVMRPTVLFIADECNSAAQDENQRYDQTAAPCSRRRRLSTGGSRAPAGGAGEGLLIVRRQ